MRDWRVVKKARTAQGRGKDIVNQIIIKNRQRLVNGRMMQQENVTIGNWVCISEFLSCSISGVPTSKEKTTQRGRDRFLSQKRQGSIKNLENQAKKEGGS